MRRTAARLRRECRFSEADLISFADRLLRQRLLHVLPRHFRCHFHRTPPPISWPPRQMLQRRCRSRCHYERYAAAAAAFYFAPPRPSPPPCACLMGAQPPAFAPMMPPLADAFRPTPAAFLFSRRGDYSFICRRCRYRRLLFFFSPFTCASCCRFLFTPFDIAAPPR